jgi:hypothetical protein
MPYISQSLREAVDPAIDDLLAALKASEEANLKGILNYTITRICAGLYGPSWRYTKIADVISALECAKLEFYSRVARPYEDSKIAFEGDVKEYRR